jgi:hypothetical protein
VLTRDIGAPQKLRVLHSNLIENAHIAFALLLARDNELSIGDSPSIVAVACRRLRAARLRTRAAAARFGSCLSTRSVL